jgi:hypothetical protein
MLAKSISPNELHKCGKHGEDRRPLVFCKKPCTVQELPRDAFTRCIFSLYQQCDTAPENVRNRTSARFLHCDYAQRQVGPPGSPSAWPAGVEAPTPMMQVEPAAFACTADAAHPVAVRAVIVSVTPDEPVGAV